MSFSDPLGVQRNFRVIEHHQQFVFVGVQPLQQTVKGDEACAPLKDAIEARPQFTASTPRRLEPVGLQVGIEPYVDGRLLARCWAVS